MGVSGGCGVGTSGVVGGTGAVPLASLAAEFFRVLSSC